MQYLVCLELGGRFLVYYNNTKSSSNPRVTASPSGGVKGERSLVELVFHKIFLTPVRVGSSPSECWYNNLSYIINLQSAALLKRFETVFGVSFSEC